MTDLLPWVALQDLFCTKPLLAQRLCERFGSPQAVLTSPRDPLGASDAEWDALSHIRSQVDWPGVEATIRWCQAEQVRIVTMADDAYPSALRQIVDRPLLLYVRGDARALEIPPLVAIVGARKATAYGRAMAATIARGLTAAGVTIVSGLAIGIDGVVHREAVAGGGRTIGVLGGGLDRFFPPAHRLLADQMVATGAVITEFPPRMSPLGHHFPQRNRIISGLSLAVLVVEAAERSGTLSTAHHAMEQGRLVSAVPGSAGHVMTRGTHHLLREGAHLVERAEDLLQLIRPMWRPSPCQAPEEDGIGRVLLPLLHSPQCLDLLVARSGRPVETVLAWLGRMEAAGAVETLPGSRYIRRERTHGEGARHC